VSENKLANEQLQAKLDDARRSSEYAAEQMIDSITEAIVDRMFDLQLSRAELANRLNVSPARVTNLLRGGNFTVRTLAELGDALGCDVAVQFRPHTIDAAVGNTGAEVAAETRAAYRTRHSAPRYASRDAEIRDHLDSGKLKVEDGVVYMWRERDQAYAPATLRPTRGRSDILRTNVGSRAYYKERILAVAETVARSGQE
jgi:transcriptional regulator with XRE-family HTH domain